MNILFEILSKKDFSRALQIYNHFIINSVSNFEEKKMLMKDFKFLYNKNRKNRLPFLLAKKNSEVLGLAFVSKFREKSGYRFTYEHSIYVDPSYINSGYGSVILKKLLKQCKQNKNIKNLIAVIGSSDNIASIKIHKKCGFKYIGTLKKVGFKKNRWVDSVYMQKKL